jgi:hypothetical protein
MISIKQTNKCFALQIGKLQAGWSRWRFWFDGNDSIGSQRKALQVEERKQEAERTNHSGNNFGLKPSVNIVENQGLGSSDFAKISGMAVSMLFEQNFKELSISVSVIDLAKILAKT